MTINVSSMINDDNKSVPLVIGNDYERVLFIINSLWRFL